MQRTQVTDLGRQVNISCSIVFKAWHDVVWCVFSCFFVFVAGMRLVKYFFILITRQKAAKGGKSRNTRFAIADFGLAIGEGATMADGVWVLLRDAVPRSGE